MSNFKTYFKNAVSVCKKGFAYVKVVPVLIKAVHQRLVGNGYYDVSFIKIGRKWYCEVPNFPKELFEHTLMVGGASKFLDYHAKENKKVVITIKITDKENGNMRLVKNSSTLTGGAFYNDLSGCVNEEIWLCPVTLFLLGKYPKNIQILETKNMRCIPTEEQIKHILDAAIEHSLNDARQYFEDTIVAEYNNAKNYHQRFNLVIDFAESVGYDCYNN